MWISGIKKYSEMNNGSDWWTWELYQGDTRWQGWPKAKYNGGDK